jgi:hypothetical protein
MKKIDIETMEVEISGSPLSQTIKLAEKINEIVDVVNRLEKLSKMDLM